MTNGNVFKIMDYPDFIAVVEYSEEFIVVHLNLIGEFTKDLYNKLDGLLKGYSKFVASTHYGTLYGVIEGDNEKMIRLAKSLGFTEQGVSIGLKVFAYRGEV